MDKKNSLTILAHNSGYVLHNGKLHKCNYTRTEFYNRINDENGNPMFCHQHFVTLSDGTELAPEDNEIFDKAEDFEVNAPADVKTKKLSEVVHNIMATKHLYRYNSEVVEFWTFEDGKPVEHKKMPESFTYNYSICEFRASHFYPDGEIYATYDEAIKFNDYKVVEDGNEVIHTGASKLVMLDPDQKMLIERLRSLMEEIKAADIELVAENCSEQIDAYNRRNVADLAVTGYGDKPGEDWEQVNVNTWRFDTDVSIPIWGEDYEVHIKRK